jgi:hypothetical protein
VSGFYCDVKPNICMKKDQKVVQRPVPDAYEFFWIPFSWMSLFTVGMCKSRRFSVVFPMLVPILLLGCSKFNSRWYIPGWGGAGWSNPCVTMGDPCM